MKKKLEWLEAMRALAACWVLVHHADLTVSAFVGPLGGGNTVIANGYLGVDFFFVLSGFIIAFSSNRLLETGRGFSDYARARLIRIYVPYLPIGIAMLLAYLLFPDFSAADRVPGVLTSLTLLPTASPPALSVAWTLIHELLFYALFSIIFVSRKALWLLLAGWAILIVAYASFDQPLQSGWKYVLSPLNLCFLLGVALYYLTRNGLSAWVPVVGGTFGAIVLVVQAVQTDPNRLLLALAFAGFILSAMSSWAQRWSPASCVLFVGAASYSIYLVHNPLESVAIRIVNRLIPGLSPWPAFLLISAAALLAGLAYYYLYERHALALARRTFSPAGSVASAAPSSAIAEAKSR